MARNFGKNKKGSVLDLLLIVGVMLFFGIVVLLGFKFMSEFNTQIQSMDDVPAKAKTASTQLTNHYTGAVDSSALFLLVVLSVSALILASLVRVHPVFIPIFILLLAFIVFYSAVLSNVYQEMASNPNLINEADQLKVTTTILTYLPIIITVLGGFIMVIMYKSWQGAQNG